MSERLPRARGPAFSEEETSALLDLIAENKSILCHPNTSNLFVDKKNATWHSLCYQLMKRGFPLRTTNQVFNKWKNLKELVRVHIKKGAQIPERDKVFADRTFEIITETMEMETQDSVDESSSKFDGTNILDWGQPISNVLSRRGRKLHRHSFRSANFTAEETNFLLRCIQDDKQFIDNRSADRDARRQAWLRVTAAYNNHFPNNTRTTDKLQHRYENIKQKERQERQKMQPLIKQELDDSAHVVEVEISNARDSGDDEKVLSPEKFPKIFCNENAMTENDPDPLSSVLTGYTDTRIHELNVKEDAEVTRLKIRLLNYQMETAKLERERVEAAMRADDEERVQRRELLELQLREARLNLSAAEHRHSQQTQHAVHNGYHNPML